MVPNPLYGKTAVFDGDSICAGTVGISSTDPKYGWGWAGRIGTNNRMTWHNFGVAGGTVCTDTYNYTNAGTTNIDWTQDTYIRIGSSASGTDTMYQAVTQDTWDGTHNVYYRGDARHWESTDIDTIYTAYPKADYVILEACLNDGFNGVPKGSVSASYSDSFVTTTWSSAFEYMLKRAIQKFPRAKIGVIFPPRPDGSNAYISELNGLAKQVCEKWGIPYIDLYKASGMCVNVSEQAAIMYYDSTHPSQDGYDFFTPKIEKWMQTL
jgi:lysophospholipase L1-like esterase